MPISTRRLCIFAVAIVLTLVSLHRCHAAVSTPTRLLSYTKNAIVWQKIGTWLMITEDLPTGRTFYYYDPARRTKLNLKKPQPGDWMPLGSAIKWLMFVQNVNGVGVLMAHSVDSHYYQPAWPSAQSQVGCAMADTRCVFGQYRATMVGDHYPVDLYCLDVRTGACVPLCVSDSEKSQFAHDGNLIVYRARWSLSHVGIYGQYFGGGDEFPITFRNGIEPAVCGQIVAWAEANCAGWNIVAKNIVTRELRVVGYTTANPPRPEVGPGTVFWQDARNYAKTGVDIRGYDWALAKEFVVSAAAGDQYGLRVSGDTITWLTGPINYQTVWCAKVEPGR